MDHMRIAEQIMKTVDSMIDPRASLEQQLSQMRAQLEALSQLPMIIQQKVDAVNRQIDHIREMNFKEVRQEKYLDIEKPGQERIVQFERHPEDSRHSVEITELEPDNDVEGEEKNVAIKVTKPSLTEEELQLQKEDVKKMLESKMKRDTHQEETTHQIQLENQKETIHKIHVENQPQTIPRPKPTPSFGPAPQERPLVLPGGRKWKKSMEYNEELIQETLTAQAEVIKGNAIGVNFMKYQKPPLALDHLQRSEVFKAIHNMDEAPSRKVEMLRPAYAEADYRERARPMSPSPNSR